MDVVQNQGNILRSLLSEHKETLEIPSPDLFLLWDKLAIWLLQDYITELGFGK